MQLNWSTFVLEIINFLILVWVLKRFLYKPVLAAIAQRCRLELVPGHPVAALPSITLRPRHGMRMTIDRIAHDSNQRKN